VKSARTVTLTDVVVADVVVVGDTLVVVVDDVVVATVDVDTVVVAGDGELDEPPHWLTAAAPAAIDAATSSRETILVFMGTPLRISRRFRPAA